MTTFANSSTVQVAYVEEATFGVTPTTGATSHFLRVTGESLDFAVTKTPSTEINSTRTISSMIPTSASATGGVNCEVSYKEYDRLLAAALQSDFSVYGTAGVGTTFTADFTATTITADAAPTGASAFTTLQLGQWFTVNAGSTVNSHKLFRVSTTVAPTSTIITLSASTPATIAAAVPTVSVATSRLTHGITQKSFTFERQATDISQYFAYRGLTLGGFDLSVSSGALSKLNFTFIGKDAVPSASTTLPGTIAASEAFEIHSGVAGSACRLWINGVYQPSVFVKTASVKYDNALRSQEAIATLGAVSVGSGTINCTGSMEIYLADSTLFSAFVANTPISLAISSLDADGNGYVINLPHANLTKVATTAGGKDADMMLAVDYTALRDSANAVPALQKAVIIDRVGVAA